MKLAGNGDVQWRKLLTSKENANYIRPVCGIATSDRYILVGAKSQIYFDQPTSTGKTGISHPWLGKIDDKGTLVWEKLLTEDQDGLYDAVYVSVGPKYCAGPILDHSGFVTFALRIYSRPTFVKNDTRIVDGPGTRDKAKLVLLVAQFDQNGNERAKVRIGETVRSSLHVSETGFVVLENPVPAYKRGIQRTWLDQDLNIVRRDEASFNGYSYLLEGVVPDARNGFHVSGYQVFPPNERGRTALAYFNSSGELVGLEAFGQGLPSWAIVDLAPAQNMNEVALLMRRDNRVKLLKLRFQN
jgi:hypothetical protein